MLTSPRLAGKSTKITRCEQRHSLMNSMTDANVSARCHGRFRSYQIGRNRGVRRRPHGNYLIFYRVTPESVEVLHILHGARDYEAVLFPDE